MSKRIHFEVMQNDGTFTPLDLPPGQQRWLEDTILNPKRPVCENTFAVTVYRKARLRAIEERAEKRVQRRRVSITAARVLGRDWERILYWERMTREAQQLADNLWLARVNPEVPR